MRIKLKGSIDDVQGVNVKMSSQERLMQLCFTVNGNFHTEYFEFGETAKGDSLEVFEAITKNLLSFINETLLNKGYFNFDEDFKFLYESSRKVYLEVEKMQKGKTPPREDRH